MVVHNLSLPGFFEPRAAFWTRFWPDVGLCDLAWPMWAMAVVTFALPVNLDSSIKGGSVVGHGSILSNGWVAEHPNG